MRATLPLDYVGKRCQALISELASHIYWWWSTYKRPIPEAALWRYMDFTKFVALLKDNALYFARADHLGDPFEGARGLAEREAEWKAHCLEYFREAIRTVPGQMEVPLAERIEEDAERLYRDFEAIGKREVQNTYVSCWHANEGESEALWRLYAPPPTIGIAIQTEFGALDRALADGFDIKFGYVQYVDFAKTFAGTYDRIFWKRASLSHEAAVRAVITKDWSYTADEIGLFVPLKLSQAIKGVVVSPFAPKWFNSVMKEVMQKFSLDVPIRASELLAEPFF